MTRVSSFFQAGSSKRDMKIRMWEEDRLYRKIPRGNFRIQTTKKWKGASTIFTNFPSTFVKNCSIKRGAWENIIFIRRHCLPSWNGSVQLLESLLPRLARNSKLQGTNRWWYEKIGSQQTGTASLSLSLASSRISSSRTESSSLHQFVTDHQVKLGLLPIKLESSKCRTYLHELKWKKMINNGSRFSLFASLNGSIVSGFSSPAGVQLLEVVLALLHRIDSLL